MAPAKTPTESKNWLPLLLALMAALAGLVLWDRQSGDGAQKGAGAPAVVRAADKSARVTVPNRCRLIIVKSPDSGSRGSVVTYSPKSTSASAAVSTAEWASFISASPS